MRKALIFVSLLFCSIALADEGDSVIKCQRILRAYCPAFSSVTANADKILLQLNNGGSIVCEDGVDYDMLDTKQYAQQINAPDLAAMLQWEYPLGEVEFPITLADGDPGRIRVEPLFLQIYGASKEAVQKNLVTVDFLGQKAQVNKQLGAAAALANISAELEQIEGFKERFWQSRDFSGTFNWRKVAGTNRLSVHSFGAAVDFTIKNDPSKKTYWLWVADCIVPGCEKIEENLKVQAVDENSLDLFAIKNSGLTPAEVVAVFEKHGYIWGGKWHHFDTMHFEYRPEFLDFDSQEKCDLEDDLLGAP